MKHAAVFAGTDTLRPSVVVILCKPETDFCTTCVRGMSTFDSLAVIAAGRDAGDAAFMETAGWASVVWQEVKVGVNAKRQLDS